MPKSKLFLVIASTAGVLSVTAMEAGWVVSEVGRQPWIVYNLMTVEEAATANEGVWITFIAVVVLYSALAVGVVVVLRSMSKKFRRQGDDGHSVPYGPTRKSVPAGSASPTTEPSEGEE
jgi:cytochrome d ubiquinol oxidase subunit I